MIGDGEQESLERLVEGGWAANLVEEDCRVDYVSVHGFSIGLFIFIEAVIRELLTGKTSMACIEDKFLGRQSCLLLQGETSRRQVPRR